jgi:alanine-alpha-ketoisovalerate/valine-pyruvate aminotransferase
VDYHDSGISTVIPNIELTDRKRFQYRLSFYNLAIDEKLII